MLRAAAQRLPKEGEQVNLRFVSWQTANKELDKKVAEAYTKEHPNVTITYDYYGDMTAAEYYKKVDMMVMGGEEMDILMASAFPSMLREQHPAHICLWKSSLRRKV